MSISCNSTEQSFLFCTPPPTPGKHTHSDGGYTFEKDAIVPPFDASPNGYDVLGWRDPFVFQSDALESGKW